MREPVWVWGVPFAPVTLEETVEAVDALIEKGVPSYFITANLHYVMLTSELPDLAAINADAALIVADGAPIVRAARRRPIPLPERVAGSDLIFHLCELAAKRGHRLFFLGAPEGVADEAAEKLRARYPGLQIAGTECPPFRPLTDAENDQLVDRIRAARPDLLFTAFSQPKGDRWIFENYKRIGVPVCVNLGASLDFAAGRIARAPLWMQKAGLEWAFRLLREPRRLFSRYAGNARFLGRVVLLDLLKIQKADQPRLSSEAPAAAESS